MYAAGSTEKPGVILNFMLNFLSVPVLVPVSTVTRDVENAAGGLKVSF